MSIATKCTCHMSSNGFCNSSVKQCTKLIKMEEKKYVPCGGCGATHPSQICIGCQHLFPLEDEPHYKIHSAAIIGHGKPEINHDRVISNQVAGMPLEEAIFQDGYSAGVEFEKRRSKTGPVWVKANSPGIKNGEYVAKFKAPGIKLKHDFVGMAFVDDQFVHFVCPCHYDLKWAKDHEELQYVSILDEAASSGERDPYAGFRETIENIIHSAGKHNQEQCTEIADAILRDLSIGLCCQKKKSPSGEREVDAVAFNIYCTDSYYYENGFWWHKENHDPYAVDQLYDIFKQQREE